MDSNSDKLATGTIEGEGALQPVRLVLLLLAGPREGENDFIEFPSVADAFDYACQMLGEPRFQLEAIEEISGKPIMGYDELNDRCRLARPMPFRRTAVGE